MNMFAQHAKTKVKQHGKIFYNKNNMVKTKFNVKIFVFGLRKTMSAILVFWPVFLWVV